MWHVFLHPGGEAHHGKGYFGFSYSLQNVFDGRFDDTVGTLVLNQFDRDTLLCGAIRIQYLAYPCPAFARLGNVPPNPLGNSEENGIPAPPPCGPPS